MRKQLSRQLMYIIYLHLFSAWRMGLDGAMIVEGILAVEGNKQ
jgi:hypothetical protein